MKEFIQAAGKRCQMKAQIHRRENKSPHTPHVHML